MGSDDPQLLKAALAALHSADFTAEPAIDTHDSPVPLVEEVVDNERFTEGTDGESAGQTIVLTVPDLHCQSCSQRVGRMLAEEGGKNVSVSVLSKLVRFDVCAVRVFSTEKYILQSLGEESIERIVSRLENAGYPVTEIREERSTAQAVWQRMQMALHRGEAASRSSWLRFVTAAALTAPLLALGSHFGLHSETLSSWLQTTLPPSGPLALQATLALAVVAGCGSSFFVRAWRLARHGKTSMDSLVGLGTGSAYVASLVTALGGSVGGALCFDCAALLTAIVLFGRHLEAHAQQRATHLLGTLASGVPHTAHKASTTQTTFEQQWNEVPVDNVRAGDLVLVKPGQCVPVDGEVCLFDSAHKVGFFVSPCAANALQVAFLDESVLTGESRPRGKAVGATVMAGSVLVPSLTQGASGAGALLVRATRVAEDTTLSGIMRLVESGQSTRPPVQRIVDRISSHFIGIVLTASALTTAGWLIAGPSVVTALEAGISVLLVACPCALGLATPIALQIAYARAADHGIVFRNPEALEAALQLKCVVLDKTGTLTHGHPHVVNTHATSPQHALHLAASLSSLSNHPFDRAITRAACEQDTLLHSVEGFQAHVGRGLSATVDGKTVLLGSRRHLEKCGATISESALAAAQTADKRGDSAVFLAHGGYCDTVFSLKDPLHPGSVAAVRALQDRGVVCVLASGDQPGAVNAAAFELGLSQDATHAEQTPREKMALVLEMQTKHGATACVGDGLNDAPALAAADVGFGLQSGTDIAMYTADVVLMRADGDLGAVADTVRLSAATTRIIKQNLFLAFGYNVCMIPLAVGGVLSPPIAAMAMSLSSLTVVGNALRLRWLDFSTRNNLCNSETTD